MRILRKCILFYFGGFAYFLLEILWRGRSHGSMFLLGGTCFLLIGKLNRWLRRIPPVLRLLTFSGVVTVLELLTGFLVNRDHSVWDYRRLPFQFRGQICLMYSLLWIPVSFLASQLHAGAEKTLARFSESRD